MNDIYILNILLDSMSKKSFKPSKKVFFVALLLLLIASGITASLLDKKNNYVLSLKQVQHSLVSIPPQPIDSKNNLKPVYTKGLLTSSDTIRDKQLGISLKALALHRKVYMYQWKEKTAVNSKVSIIAQQYEDKLQPFLAQAGQRVFIVEAGEHSADELIHSAIAQYQNNSLFSSVREIIRADTGF